VNRLTVRGAGIEFTDLPARGGRQGGPTLVFLHEGLGSARLWRSFPGSVAAMTGLRTVVWSRHGYGDSDVVERDRGVGYMHEEALEVLPALLDALGVGASVLINPAGRLQTQLLSRWQVL